MSVSIISCPNCHTMLLDDTVQCPNCRHILGKGMLVETGERNTRSDVAYARQEDPCPSCGEMVRRGLVRCWNCSTFMRDDIAKSYQGMRQSPSPVIYSLPQDGADSDTGPTYQFEESTDDDQATGWIDDDLVNLPDIADDDLLLAPLVNAEPDEDDFETAPGFEPRVDETAVTETAASLQTISTVPPDVLDDILSSSDTEDTSWITGDPMPAEDLTASSDSDAPAPTSAPDGGDRSQPAANDTDSNVPHSVATAGDVLLQAALEQEAEATRRKKKPGRQASRGRVLVYCPNGHRIEVSERHRGQTGRCPKCKSPFFVPAEDWESRSAQSADENAGPTDSGQSGETADSESSQATGQKLRWMEDIRLHKVDPTKLKLKTDSLTGEFQPVDLHFADDNILLVSLAAGKGGLFGGGKKTSPDEARETVRTEVAEGKPLKDLSAAWSDAIDADAVSGIVIVQPAQDDYSSMFAGIPVFGEGRIAVRIPKAEGESLLRFLSFELSTFRRFAQNLDEVYHVSLPGAEFGIPMTDSFVEKVCHYSEQTLAVLQNVEFYQADPAFDVKLMGRECQGCGLVVSEDSRKKEKIGGTSGKGIAKAKCPKCEQRFGDISLFTIDVETQSASESSDDEGNAADSDADSSSASDESAT